MQIRDISEKERKDFNSVVDHPLQSFEWGEFRKKTGIKVIRKGLFENGKLIDGFQLTIHKIPHVTWTIGYLPKGKLPTKEIIEELKKIGKEEKCIFIQLEPNTTITSEESFGHLRGGEATSSTPRRCSPQDLKLVPSFHPLFTKFTFILDLTKNEEELLKNMHPKTRYNIKVAQKHNVKIIEDNSGIAFEEYLRLTTETTKRQNFYAHTQSYHRKMWETLKVQSSKFNPDLIGVKIQNLDTNNLTAHLFLAQHNPLSIEQGTKDKRLMTNDQSPLTLAAWVLFVFKDTLYYPYGASSSEHRETMASNLMMWQAILFGKKIGLKKFDMWGALGNNPDKKDPWYGFHRFKEGYGPKRTQFLGSYDLIINPILYLGYKIIDKIRWGYLRLLR